MFAIFHDFLHVLGRGLSLLYDAIPSYGISIILFTVLIRLAMLPLTIKQTRSMQAMQKLQPEIKRLQAKYKGGDRQKLNEESMKLYKEHQVNPLGGCLPLLLQLPVFLSLYRVFAGCGKVIDKVHHKCAPGYVGTLYLPKGALKSAIIAGHAGFLGMNLGRTPAESMRMHGLASTIPYILLVAFMAVSTWYQQHQMTASTPAAQASQMQAMGKIMPIMLAVFSINLPAGVSAYWIASNIWTIGQQHLLLGKPEESSKGKAAKPSPGPGTKTRELDAKKNAQRAAAEEANGKKTQPKPQAPKASPNGSKPKAPRPQGQGGKRPAGKGASRRKKRSR